MTPTVEVEARVHQQLLEGARAGDAPLTRATIVELVRREAPLLGAGELDTIVRHVSARTGGLGPLESLLADPTITEVMVNASTGVWIERDGMLSRTDLLLDDGTVAHLIERVRRAARLARRPISPARRRAPPRRLSRERCRPTGGDRRPVPHDPSLRSPHARSRRVLFVGRRGLASQRCLRRGATCS